MEYITRDGLRIEVGRVNRRLLDAIAIPEPQPPLRDVETWGELVERVPVYDDPGYKMQLFEYRLRLWREQLNVLSAGIALPDAPEIRQQLDGLAHVIGDVQHNRKGAFLRYCLSDADRAVIVEQILYQSTVTQRGITEACAFFAYKWRGKPLEAWHTSGSNGERGMLAVEWRAAIRSGLTWERFSSLSGYEQSQHVAFWMLEDKLQALLSQ